MTENGRKIREHLERYQNDLSLGFEECSHRYSRNGTISCIKCGKIKHSIIFHQIHDPIQDYTVNEKINLL
ncbi:MAG: hypothetical protein JHC41_04980 [Nitrosopumilus sp.]|jgi:hypothetical protein|nr:hypothetical protein [Nitrosopumilus sp.]